MPERDGGYRAAVADTSSECLQGTHPSKQQQRDPDIRLEIHNETQVEEVGRAAPHFADLYGESLAGLRIVLRPPETTIRSDTLESIPPPKPSLIRSL